MGQYHIKRNLFAHQVKGIEETIKNLHGFANFSEMGTGKSLMAIGTLNHCKANGLINKALIICPNTLKYVWLDELKSSEIEWKVCALDGSSEKRKEVLTWHGHQYDIIIVNYDSVKLIVKELIKWSPDYIILDEAHAVKSHKAQRTKAIKSIPCKYKLAMTGTPMTQSPLDVWSVFDWIRKGYLFDNFFVFRARYANVYTGAGFPLIRGFRNLGELAEKVSRYSYRVLKQECLDLPEKQYQTIEFDLSKSERSLYDDMARHLVIEVGDNEIAAANAMVKMVKLQQITSGFIIDACKTVVSTGDSKVKALEQLLESLDGHKVVVWCKFKEEISRIESLCVNKKIPVYTLHGELNEAERHENIAKFRGSEKGAVLAGNISIGGVGITVTESSHTIFFSNPWSLGDRLQAEDRNHRIGQVNKVTYYDLVARNTIDGYVSRVLTNKEKLADRLTGDDLKRIVNNS